MKFLVLTMLLLAAYCAQAELFKWVDADGNIIYSDQPPPGAEKKDHQVDEEALPHLNTTPALETPVTSSTSSKANKEDAKERYKSVAIVEPENDTSMRQNAGNVSIKVAIDPYLFNERGDTLAIYMDGFEVSRGRDLSVQLVEVDRGTHVIRAEIVNSKGKVIKKANPVTFTLHRYSALF